MRRAQLSFGDGLIAEEVSDLRDHWMEAADRVLADEEIVAAVYDGLAQRHPKSRSRGRKGTAIIRGLLVERDPAYTPTESERELMLVRLLRQHGLPEPERQFSIRDGEGNYIARPDLVYRDLKIAMEYDSYERHVGKHALVRDSRRRNAAAELGWIVLVATAEDVRYGNGNVFARDVRMARQSREAALRT